MSTYRERKLGANAQDIQQRVDFAKRTREELEASDMKNNPNEGAVISHLNTQLWKPIQTIDNMSVFHDPDHDEYDYKSIIRKPANNAASNSAVSVKNDGTSQTTATTTPVTTTETNASTTANTNTATTPTLTPQQQYDQDYLNGMDEESRKRTQGIINADGLQAQIDAAKWAEETPEQQAARLKKERNERNLVGAVGLLGALGNFAVAAGHPSGRSVPVLNVSDSVDKRQTAAQQQRELALAKLNKARGRMSQLIEQGYKDTDTRKQLAEQREIQRNNQAIQIANLNRNLENDAYRRDYQERKLQLDADNKKQALEMKAKVDASTIARNNATASRARNGGSSSNTDTNFHIENADGSITKVAISKNDFDTAMTKAYDKLTGKAKEYADSMISQMVENILKNEKSTVEEIDRARLWEKGKNASKWIQKNPKLFHQILQMVENRKGELDGYDEAFKYLQKIGRVSSGKSGGSDIEVDFENAEEDEEENEEETDI